MSVKVGVPRALMYYEYYPMWKTFFETLGVQVILSKATTKTILNNGLGLCVDGACLPIKVFHGHVMDLKDKVDYLFIPRLQSVARREYICPKFCGLPEMIKFSIPDLPPIIDCEVNLRKSNRGLYKSFEEIGKYFTSSSREIQNAYKKAIKEQEIYKENLKTGKSPMELLEKRKLDHDRKENLRIGLVGHVYNIYDPYISMNLIELLENQGIKVITPEMLDDDLIRKKADALPKAIFWTFGKRIMGSVLDLLDQDDIDGIIYLMSFGCGIDAFIADLCERKIRRETDIPFFLLTLDEHSGIAGVQTRLEAFVDMIKWRNDHDSNISAHG